MIKINPIPYPTPDQTVGFVPSNLNAAAGDIVFWQNNDENSAHQPMPVNGAADDWTDLIPAKLSGQPAPTSLRNPTFADPGTYKYVCALHNDEQGAIIVA
jgi:plastocyanin